MSGSHLWSIVKLPSCQIVEEIGRWFYYYDQNRASDIACGFGGSGVKTNKNPSYDKCLYMTERSRFIAVFEGRNRAKAKNHRCKGIKRKLEHKILVVGTAAKNFQIGDIAISAEQLKHWPDPGVNDNKKIALFDQVARLNGSYSGGLSLYIKATEELLVDSKARKNTFDGFTTSIPSGEVWTFGDANFIQFKDPGSSPEWCKILNISCNQHSVTTSF